MTFKYIKVEQMETHFCGDHSLIKEIVNVFEETYQDVISETQKSIETTDSELLERSAHTLKGMVSNFFVEDIVKGFSTLEKKGVDSSFDGTHDLLVELQGKLEEMLAELNEYVTQVVSNE